VIGEGFCEHGAGGVVSCKDLDVHSEDSAIGVGEGEECVKGGVCDVVGHGRSESLDAEQEVTGQGAAGVDFGSETSATLLPGIEDCKEPGTGGWVGVGPWGAMGRGEGHAAFQQFVFTPLAFGAEVLEQTNAQARGGRGRAWRNDIGFF